jgi:hypothetical protein
MMVSILCFRVWKHKDEFRAPDEDDKPYNMPINNVDWSLQSSEFLTTSLLTQSNNNVAELYRLWLLCGDNSNTRGRIPRIKIKASDDPSCGVFSERISAYLDVFVRDEHALDQTNFDSPIYVVVVLNNGEYYGHIYIWISHHRCYAIGIRSRVDAVFLRGTSRELRNIAQYLFEGVRLFALFHGYDHFYVTFPLDSILSLLKSIGFNRKMEFLTKYLGHNIAYYISYDIDMTDDIYQSPNLSESFIKSKVSFQYFP